MELLALTSKVLYDRDILEKQKRITVLEKRIKELHKKINEPKTFYNSYQELQQAKEKAYTHLKQKLSVIFNENDMLFNITPRQEIDIIIALTKCLTDLTKERIWADKTANIILNGIQGFIHGMLATAIWPILSNLELNSVIYENIIWIIDGPHSNCILGEAFLLKCYKCQRIDTFVDYDNYCIDCSEI